MSQSDIRSDMETLKSINIEIARLTENIKKLKMNAKQTEHRIMVYLEEKKQRGVKLPEDQSGNKVGYFIETKQKVLPKPEKEKNLSSIEILKNNNVKNPEKVLEELLKSRKGEKIVVPKLKQINK